MEFRDYQRFAIVSAIYNEAQDAIIYPALGLGNEAGEVLGKIKKVLRDKGGNYTHEAKMDILDEMGDCLWYLAALARDLGYELGDAAQMNIDKLKSRRERNVIGGSGDKR